MDYLVIGAGPAGLQLGWLLQRAGRDHAILEVGTTPGTFYRRFPRHRRMISINKPHTGWEDPELNLRMDWNSLLSDNPDLLFTRYTQDYFPHADDYVRYLTDYANRFDLNVLYDTQVTRIARAGADGSIRVDRQSEHKGVGAGFATDQAGEFVLTDQHGHEHGAKRVIVATGFGAPYLPPIPGIELTEQYGEVTLDPDDFTNQRVLIIGKGNSAFETADHLVERAAVIHVLGPHSIKFAWRTHFIGHLRAVNNNFLDTYSLKSQNMVLDATIERIERVGPEYLVTMHYARRDRSAQLAYDRVITCTGFRMDTSIFDDSCRPELTINDRFPALTPEWESLNVPGLYFAGTLTQSRDFKEHTSAFIHGFRYGVRALQRILDRKHEGIAWPHRELPVDPTALTDVVLARVNRSSGLWQQYAFLCDVIELVPEAPRDPETDRVSEAGKGDGGTARHYEEVPVDHVLDGGFGLAGRFLMVTLEYGPNHDAIDPFDVSVGRRWEAEHDEDRYLHPVIRHYEQGELVSKLPLPEDLCNDWSGEASHREPLLRFLTAALPSASPTPAPAPAR